jgi:hypothetical protein
MRAKERLNRKKRFYQAVPKRLFFGKTRRRHGRSGDPWPSKAAQKPETNFTMKIWFSHLTPFYDPFFEGE